MACCPGVEMRITYKGSCIMKKIFVVSFVLILVFCSAIFLFSLVEKQENKQEPDVVIRMPDSSLQEFEGIVRAVRFRDEKEKDRWFMRLYERVGSTTTLIRPQEKESEVLILLNGKLSDQELAATLPQNREIRMTLNEKELTTGNIQQLQRQLFLRTRAMHLPQ